MKNWTTTQLISAGGLGVLTFLLSLPGVFLSVILQIPGSSLILAGLVGAMMAVFVSFLFKKFGAMTITLTLYGLLALPTPIGPPGFIPKVFGFFLLGLFLDAVYLKLKNETKLTAMILGSSSLMVLFLLTAILYSIFLPELAKIYWPKVHFILAFAAIQGIIGGVFGRFVYLKLKKTNIISRITQTR